MLVNMVTKLWIQHNEENFLTSLGAVSFSRRTLFHDWMNKWINDWMKEGKKVGWFVHLCFFPSQSVN
jgi:hypothetical protein